MKFTLGSQMLFSYAWGPGTNTFIEHPGNGFGDGAFTLNADGTTAVAVTLAWAPDFWFYHGLIFFIGWGFFSFGTIISNRYLQKHYKVSMWIHYVAGWATILCTLIMGVWTIAVDRRRLRRLSLLHDARHDSSCIFANFRELSGSHDDGGDAGGDTGSSGISPYGDLEDLHETISNPIIWATLALGIAGYATRFIHIYMPYNASLMHIVKLFH